MGGGIYLTYKVSCQNLWWKSYMGMATRKDDLGIVLMEGLSQLMATPQGGSQGNEHSDLSLLPTPVPAKILTG